jgi:hypothetical protein
MRGEAEEDGDWGGEQMRAEKRRGKERGAE